MVEKKNPDYSESAVNLTNPLEVQGFLAIRQKLLGEIDTLDAMLKAYPEYEQILAKREAVNQLETELRQAIDKYGSYQDTTQGWYAVKQIRKTISFIAEKIREVIPAYAEAVIDGVNKTKMNGLLRGGLISQEQADKCSQIKEDYAYIIK